MKASKIIILALVILAFLAGAYFKNDALRLYDNFSKGLQDFKKTELGNLITEAGKKIFTPPPLNIGGKYNNIVLVKSKIIEETNNQRALNNLPALAENTRLSEAASAKANDMFLNQYFEHMSPSGIDPGKLVQSYGYEYIIAGENLILGNFSSEKEAVADWMASPGHRANILNNRYTEIGVAVIRGAYKGETVWISVQEFGLPLSSCPKPDISLKNSIDLNKMQIDSLFSQAEAKKTEIDNTNKKSAHYSQLVDDYNQLVKEYNSLAESTKATITSYNSQVNIFNDCVAGQ